VERWNSGFSKDIIHFKLYRQDPFFQYSSIPPFQLGRSPKLVLFKLKGNKKIIKKPECYPGFLYSSEFFKRQRANSNIASRVSRKYPGNQAMDLMNIRFSS